ncbi:MAG: TonB-dependent receptor [Acidobacteria bacterium]|nr:TonB-dependent receptor [Acidobacteriota bacterium]
MKRLWRPCCLLLLLSIGSVLSGPLWAQSEATTGVIEGIVSDPQGAVIPGATLTITNVTTAQARRLTTDANGFFRSPLLPLGTYRVSVEHPGFATLILEGVEVTLGKTVRVDAGLQVGGLGERVLVAAEESLVGLAQTETSAGLGEGALRELPTGSRDYLDHLFLTPNVHTSMGVDGPQINVNGQKNVQTGFIVDGAHANNSFFGEQRGGQRPVANVILEAVQEFQVVSEGAPAEFGGYSGAFVNVVTKSGSNDVHGSLFHLQELEALTSRLADNTRLRDYHLEHFGGSFSGPIRKDNVLFFGAYEQAITRFQKENDLIHCCTVFDAQGVAQFVPPASGGGPIDLGAIFSTQFGSAEGEPVRHTNDLQAFLIKGDWLPNPRHTVALRHYLARSIQQSDAFDVPTYGRTANGEEFSRINSFVASWSAVLSPRYLNEFRSQYARDNRELRQGPLPDLPDTSIGPCTEPRDLAPPTLGCLGRSFRFGRPFFRPAAGLDQQFQASNNFSIIQGRHAFKFGFNFLGIRFHSLFQPFARGRYTFDTVEGFLNYLNFGPTFVTCSDGSTSAVGNCPMGTFITGPLLFFAQFIPIGGHTLEEAANLTFNQYESGLFIQDTWQARSGLTISYGLRWDGYSQPAPFIPPAQTRIGQFLSDPNFPADGTFPDYYKAFQPRLGIAWDPWRNGKTVFRINGGVFFARLPGLLVGGSDNGALSAVLVSASFFNSLGMAPPAYPDCATGAFTPPSCPVPPNFQAFDPRVLLFAKDFVYPRTYQWSVWGERQLAANWAISLGFNYALATHLNRAAALNHPAPVGTLPDGRTFFGFGEGPFSGPNGSGTGICICSVFMTSQARSLYRSFTVKVDKRFSQRFLLTTHYTYSRDVDDDSNERDGTFQFSDPTDFAPERGPSNRDRRHQFALYHVWDLPWGIRWSNTVVARSASPRSLLCNFDANGDSGTGDRVFTDGQGNFSCGPAGAGRIVQLDENQRVALVPAFASGRDTGRNRFRRNDEAFDWSIRIQRDWLIKERYKLSPTLEIFNLTDNDNLRFPLCDELRDCFARAILQIAGDPRRMRLGLRLER